MKVIPVRYTKLFSPSGTVYKKAIVVDSRTFDDLEYALAVEATKTDDPVRKMRLLAQYEQKDNVIFLNLTQADVIIDAIKKTDYLEIDGKRAATVANMAVVLRP